jgi:hypothetical protein
MKQPKRQRLTKLRLDEISLVDVPANPGAEILIAKRDEAQAMTFDEALRDTTARERMWRAMEGFNDALSALRRSVETIIEDPGVTDKAAAIRDSAEQFHARLNDMAPGLAVVKSALGAITPNHKEHRGMDIETLAKNLEAAEARIAEVVKRAETAEAALAAANKRADEAVAKAAAAGGTAGDDEVLKGLDPAVRAYVEKLRSDADAAQAAIAKAADEKLTGEYIAKAATLKHLPGVVPGEFGPVLKRVLHGADDADRNAVLGVLAKASDAVAARLTTTLGTPGTIASVSDAEVEADAMAKAAMKADGTTYAVAYRKVMKDNPGLYSRIIAKN